MNNTDQIDYWNGPAGQKWVDQSARLDAMLAPFAEQVIARAAIGAGERALDIGCGAGAMTLMATRAAGGETGALGVDVSEPLLALARRRAQEAGLPALFELGDASEYVASKPADLVISRFGVMFFAEPAAAFANISRSVRPGGRAVFICWQALQANDWAFAPLQAALPFLPEPPTPADPTAPGPFAFQDKDRVAAILSEAGWQNVAVDAVEGDLTLPGEDVETSAGFMMQLGPLSRLMAQQEIDPAPVHEALAERLRGHQREDGRVAMASACWLVSADRGE